MSKKKEPLSFDTVAWLSDAELRCLGPAARGCLIDLMCYAHSGEPYGFVTVSGAPMTDAMISRLLHLDPNQWKTVRTELISSHRIDVAEHTGCLFIKRMVRDHEQRTLAKEGGKKGGNPNLLPGMPEDEKPSRQKAITATVYWNRLPLHLQTPEMRDAVVEWTEYRTRKKITLTRASMSRQIGQLTPLSPEQAVRWIQYAIDRNWRGIYPPPNGDARPGTPSASSTRTKTPKKEFPNNASPKII